MSEVQWLSSEIHHHVHKEAVLPPACSQLTTDHNRDVKARPSEEDRQHLGEASPVA